MKVLSTSLSSGWKWKQRENSLASSVLEELNLTDKWNAAQTFPSDIHVELIKAGKIPDPYVGFNEHKVQWIGEAEWLYAASFSVDDNVRNAEHVELVFEGLDTFCTVYLNEKEILKASNMFTPYTVSLKAHDLKPTNSLLLHFESAKKVAKSLEAKYGKVRAGSCNLGDPSRVYARKAQYHWRWDWGPELMSVGPWQPIYVRAYNTRIQSFYPRTSVSLDNLQPSLNLDLELSGQYPSKVHILLKDKAGKMIKEETKDLAKPENALTDVVQWKFEHSEVELWWPAGYGEQHLYTVEVTLLNSDEVLDFQTKRIGFRHVQIIQEPLVEPDRHGTGKTFLFAVNGIRMFVAGANWVPADNMLTTITPERYRAWLQLAKDGNHNMIRLWGGGIYERDVFYSTCDELGLLVWQDFQFACGVYPAHEEFVNSVKVEAEENVKRLRNHPCMAVFCGNNEDYQQVLQWGGITELPARLLYETVLPEIVSRLSNNSIPYHPGSPYGGKEWWETADPTIGDIHQWEVWAGRGAPYQDLYKMGGRFISEFGIPSMPDMRTIDYWMEGNDKDRFVQSKTMQQHTKAGSYERRFALLMNDNFRLTSDFETHVFLTQIMQSEGLGVAYRSWRREWRGKGKEYTAGVLVWQLNDSWPVVSWSLVDYFLRPKPSYYTIARELAPISVGILRTVEKNRDCDRPDQFYEFGAFTSVSATIEVWGTNSRLEEKKVSCELTCFHLESEWTHVEKHEVTLLPNQSTEILKIPCPHPKPGSDPLSTPSYSVIVSARLLDLTDGAVIARYVDWPQPFKFTDFPDPKLDIKVDGEDVIIEAKYPVKGLVLSVDEAGEEVKWSDNALDLVPGDVQKVRAKGLKGRKIKVAHLGEEKSC